MINTVAVMCVAGDPVFFEFASYSIPSFLRNNISADLCVFTDNLEEIGKYRGLSKRLNIIDLVDYFKKNQNFVEQFKAKGRPEKDIQARNERYGFEFKDIYPMIMPPMAEAMLRGKGYTHILKVDSDSYFAGGDMMAMVRSDIQQHNFADAFLVERRHPLMAHYGGGVPGSGFTLWRIGSQFIHKYINSFTGSQQLTILNLRWDRDCHIKILARPGYHVVRPFEKAQVTGVEFTKEKALQFLPAYFHLHGKDALENMKKLDEWFGEGR